MRPFAGHIVYLDESGTTVPGNARDTYPVFVLAAVCVAKQAYARQIVPDLQELKFRHFGHDQIVLHERDIRRYSGAFAALGTDLRLRDALIDDLTGLIARAEMAVLAAAIHKPQLAERQMDPLASYEIALGIVMSQVAHHLRGMGQEGHCVDLVAETRGHHEDMALELAMHRMAQGNPSSELCDSKAITGFDWRMIFADKRSNSSGLQLADLVARPVGLGVLRRNQRNRTWEAIVNKAGTRIVEYPPPKAEGPSKNSDSPAPTEKLRST